MKTSKTNLIAILVTAVAPFVAGVAVAAHPKDPGAGQGQRPVPNSGTSTVSNLKGKTIAVTQLFGTQKESSGFTITHGGNPPRGDGGFTITHGGNPPRSCGNNQTCGNNNCCNHNCCHESCHHDYCHGTYCCFQMYGNEGYEPLHSAYVVAPGDTFFTVSVKEYGTSGNSRYIAMFNRLPSFTALVPGQTLMLPSISANKVLSPSHAPVATPLQVALTN